MNINFKKLKNIYIVIYICEENLLQLIILPIFHWRWEDRDRYIVYADQLKLKYIFNSLHIVDFYFIYKS